MPHRVIARTLHKVMHGGVTSPAPDYLFSLLAAEILRWFPAQVCP